MEECFELSKQKITIKCQIFFSQAILSQGLTGLWRSNMDQELINWNGWNNSFAHLTLYSPQIT